MLEILNVLLICISATLLIPICVFSLECFLAVLPQRSKRTTEKGPRPKVAVLIPAHNEQFVIEQTLRTLLPTLSDNDRVVVVADNCDDETVQIAQQAGTTVIERNDTERRGKAYALEFGVRYLEQDPPDVVVVIDADCFVEPDTIDTISRMAHRMGRPVQSLNLCDPDPTAGPKQIVSALAMRFRNLIRPLGLSYLKLSCHLMGTGMAFPWSVIRQAPLASSKLTEDLQLGIDLAISGHFPVFCPTVKVTSGLPSQNDAFVSQRRRWEHGSLRTAITQIPRVLVHSAYQRKLRLLGIGLDLSVPPLSLLAMIWTAATITVTLLWFVGASGLPAGMLAGGGLAMLAAILTGWAVFCRHVIPWTALVMVPAYVLKKLPIYLSFFLMKHQKEWVPTKREAKSLRC